MYDFRVTPEREEVFDRFCSSPLAGSGLREAVSDYFYARIRNLSLPDYIDESLNSVNIVSGISSVKQRIRKDIYLVRVVDLNGLAPLFEWAKSSGMPVFRLAPHPKDDRSVELWLNNKLEGRSKLQVRDFIEAVLYAMNSLRRVEPFQPTWATTWDAFEPNLAGGPERWLDAVGVAKPVSPRWVLLLKYTIREAGTVARPTQLDAGSYPYHFPSPPQVVSEGGGHPMDLQVSPAAATLLPEFVHEQIDHSVEHWDKAGQVCKPTTRAMKGELDLQRSVHHRLLVRKYGRNEILAWMPECSDSCRKTCG